ncbi:hypothetical protein ACWF9G_19190 [Nocardia sp. NPDC055029]
MTSTSDVMREDDADVVVTQPHAQASVGEADSGATLGIPERLGMWCGAGMIVLFGAGFALAQFIPPPGPGDAASTAAFYRDDVLLHRCGVILMIIGGTLWIPFGAAISDRLRRIKGIGTTAATAQFGGALASGVLMMVFGSFLLVAVLRQDMPDSSYQLLSHTTWMAWGGLWQPGALQAGATAAAILSDQSEKPMFPRWIGWLSAWMAFGSLMGSLIPFFTSGPFAWNGFIGFFIAAIPFFAFLIVMFFALLRLAGKERLG